MNKKDFAFLKKLQHELNTQDNECNADPVYWGIMETREAYSPCGEEARFYIDDIESIYTREDMIEFINISFIETELDEHLIELKKEWDAADKSKVTDDYLADVLAELGAGSYLFYVNFVDYLSRETGCFLTKKAANDYIKKFGYNHSEPRAYSMTAYRNTELERFLNIFKKLDLEILNPDKNKK